MRVINTNDLYLGDLGKTDSPIRITGNRFIGNNENEPERVYKVH